jgi:hypothetical protein
VYENWPDELEVLPSGPCPPTFRRQDRGQPHFALGGQLQAARGGMYRRQWMDTGRVQEAEVSYFVSAKKIIW